MKKFYDVHMHAMDLSHANLTAFTGRLLQDMDLNLETWEKLGTFKYFSQYIRKKIWQKIGGDTFKARKSGPRQKEDLSVKIKKIRNLLAYMESSMKFDFLIIDYFLKNKEAVVSLNNEFTINDTSYNKIVLCPLIQDFGYKNIYSENYFYDIPPQKPVTDQIRDVFEAIRTYYNNDIDINPGPGFKKFDVRKIDFNPDNKLFEIYPFMGINVEYYTREKIEIMLNKYFANFDGNDSIEKRQQRLYKKLGLFDGNLENEKNCADIFAGIKVYPPLGFNPWPCDCEPAEKLSLKHLECENLQAKVELIYQFCVERNIPITTHCSSAGFVADVNHEDLTNPGTHWAKVIEAYPGLKINFAHFGAGNEEWRKTIINHILKPDSKVYTDFSCAADNNEYYVELEKTIHSSANPGLLSDRILFGTDFMINLMWTQSYNQYLKYFIETSSLTNQKVKLCNENSERFLFG
jgi:hypothetical protein